MDGIVSRIIVPHGPGCRAMAEVRAGGMLTPWGSDVAMKFLDERGDGPGTWAWWESECEDPTCPATFRIRAAEVLYAADVGAAGVRVGE